MEDDVRELIAIDQGVVLYDKHLEKEKFLPRFTEEEINAMKALLACTVCGGNCEPCSQRHYCERSSWEGGSWSKVLELAIETVQRMSEEQEID